MLHERNERRTHRRAMTAVLGCTAVIAVGGSLLVAPSANAAGLGSALGAVATPLVTSVRQVTAPIVPTSTPTPSPSTGVVGSLVNSVVAPVTTAVAGTTGTNLAPTVTSVTAPVTSTVDALLAPVTTTPVAPTTAPPVTTLVNSVTTPVTTAVTSTTGTNLAPTVGSVTTPVTSTVDPLLTPVTAAVTGTGTGTGTPTTSVAVSPTTVGSVLTGASSSLTSTTGAVAGVLNGTGSPTSVVDLTGSGTGLANTGSTGGLVGISAGAGGLSVGLLNGTVTAGIGSASTGSTVTASAGGTTATVSTVATGSTPASPADPAPAPSTPVATTPSPAATTTSSPTTPTADSAISVAAATGTPVASLRLGRSTSTVYPVKDGYRDSVRFDITGLTADEQAVGVIGTAVLKKAGRTVKSWTLNGAIRSITWNGRVGAAVRTGTYTLLVSAWSTDGTTRIASTTVQVLPQHLVSRSVTARSVVTSSGSTATMPKAVKKALALGRVTVRLRTVAKVHGKASLVFASSTVKHSLALRNGTHTTAALSVPKAFSEVTVKHVWKKGTRLVSVKAIWSYKALVR